MQLSPWLDSLKPILRCLRHAKVSRRRNSSFLIGESPEVVEVRTMLSAINVAIVSSGVGGATDAGFTQAAGFLNSDNYFNFTATVVSAASVDTAGELAAYDVVVIGNAGNSANDDPFANTAFAAALETWVNTTGGGVVATGYTAFGISVGSETDIEDVVPIAGFASSVTNGIGTVTITDSTHPVTSGVGTFSITSTGFTTVESAAAIDSGATSLATVAGPNGGGYAVVVANKGNGRSVYLGPAYVGSSSSTGASGWSWLGSGPTDRLFEQAVAWASTRPVIQTQSFSLAENSPNDTDVGTVATSTISGAATLQYAITSGNTNGAFSIEPATGQIKVANSAALDYDSTASFALGVTVTQDDGTPKTDTSVITVNLTNINEVPTDVALSSTTISENNAANVAVGNLSGSDPDAGSTFVFSLVAGAGSTDNGSFSISGNILRFTPSADFETQSSYAIRLQAKDPGGLAVENPFTITITNVNETPTDIALSPRNIAENNAANATVGTFSASDPDTGNTFTFSLVSGAGSTDNGNFTIAGNTLQITPSANFEGQSSYAVRVQATDQGGLTYEEPFVINVTNVNESPTDIALSAAVIAENNANDATVGTLTASDPDATSTFTFSLVSGAGSTDNGNFSIFDNILRITPSANFEVQSSYAIRVQARDQGGLTFVKQFVVNVTNLEENPSDIALSSSVIAENNAANATVGTLSASDSDVGSTFTFSLVSGAGSTDNGSFIITGNSLRMTSSANFEVQSSYAIRVQVSDQGGLTFEKPFTVTVTNVNEGPTEIALSASSIAENNAANATVGTLTASDPDTGNTFTFSLVSGEGSTDNGSFTISGNSLRMTPSANFEVQSSYAIRVLVADQGGLTFEKPFTVTVADENEVPTDIALSSSVIAENNAANAMIGTLTASDPDTGNTFTFSLVAGAGSTDNGNFTITGNTLRLTPSANFEAQSSYAIRVQVSDQGGTTFAKPFTVTITNVNEGPTDIALSASTIAENNASNVTLGTLSASDPDSGNTFTFALVSGAGSTDNGSFTITGNTLRLTPSANFEVQSSYAIRVQVADQGGLTFAKQLVVNVTNVNEAPTDMVLSASSIAENNAGNAAVGTLTVTDPDANNTFTFSLVSGAGSTDNNRFSITGNTLTISSSADFEVQSSYAIRVQATDQGGLTLEKQFNVNVVNVNEAPTDMALSASTITENNVTNATVGTLSASDPDSGNTITFALVGGVGSTDNDSFTITGNTLRITSSANFEVQSSYAIRVQATDQGGLTFEKQFTVIVTNVNERPTDIALSATSIAENNVTNATVGTLSASDPDSGNTYTFALVGGAGSTDNGSFTIAGNLLRLTPSANMEVQSSYAIRVQVTDQGGLTFEKPLNVTVANVNEVPTDIALSASSIVENNVANATVGTLSATDPDSGNTFTFSLVAGAGSTDNDSFTISGNALRMTSSPNFEVQSSYAIRLQATDQGGLTFEKTFTVSVTNMNEGPTDIVLSATTIAENNAANATVGTLTASDPDSGNTFTFSLVPGAGSTNNGNFTIAGNTLRISPIANFELRSSYAIRVLVTDQGGLTFAKQFTVTVSNVNEGPADIALSEASVAENNLSNTAVGTLSASDPDTGNTFTFELVSGAGSTDNNSFAITDNALLFIPSANFEAQSSYAIRVQVTDQDGLTFAKQFTVDIGDVNENPFDIELSSSVIAENNANNATVGTLTASDPDTGNTFTFALVPGVGSTDNGSFTITGDALQFIPSANFEVQSSYVIRVQATDQDGLVFEKQFTVEVANVNESPGDLALSASNIAENNIANATVGTLSASDPDTGSTFTFSLVPGSGSADNGNFTIADNTLRITSSANFEVRSSYAIRVQVTDQGGLTFEKPFTVNVTNVNEGPTDILLSASNIVENNAANATVGTLGAVDPDIGNTFTYSLVPGAGSTDNNSFNITGNTLTITSSANFETQSSYVIRVQVTDQGGLTFEKQFTVNVTNVNEVPQLALGGSAVTWQSKQAPVVVLPQITVGGAVNLANGMLTINMNAIGSAKKSLDLVNIPSFNQLGTSSGLRFANGQLTLQIQLGAGANDASVQAFLRGITFATKGKGLKVLTRALTVNLADTGGLSTSVSQTINVRKNA